MALSLYIPSYNKLAMTIRHFNTLCQHNQLRNILINGVFIADRQEEERTSLLFQVQRSYVEVVFNQECNEILDSRSFESIDELEPYLSYVNLTGVI